MKKSIYEVLQDCINQKNKMEKVIDWVERHPVIDVYENNAYDIKHRCEKDIGFYVSQDEIAEAYETIGNDVEQIKSPIYSDGYCWKIGEN